MTATTVLQKRTDVAGLLTLGQSNREQSKTGPVLLNREIKLVLFRPAFVKDTNVDDGLVREVNLNGADLGGLQKGCVGQHHAFRSLLCGCLNMCLVVFGTSTSVLALFII